MIFAILLGILLATNNASIMTAAMVIVPFIAAHALWEIAFEKMLITGTQSPYVLYVQNLGVQGDKPDRPWIGYLIQSCLFWIPSALLAYFLVNFFRSA